MSRLKGKPRPYRNGRADRVREFLQQHRGQVFSASDLAHRLDPDGDPNLMHATLASLVRGGQIARMGTGYGQVRFTALGAAANDAPPPKPVDARGRAKGKPLAKVITGLAKTPRPVAKGIKASNFAAAPGTADTTYCPHRLASARIAADIAAFEAGGGRIEKLGTTLLFHELDVANDDDDSDQ